MPLLGLASLRRRDDEMRDGETARWRDGEMARWRDGEMARRRDGRARVEGCRVLGVPRAEVRAIAGPILRDHAGFAS
ncbi:hypothetical protein D0U02_34715 [Burkholderia pseudomallei]|nr:hypothetical protein D0U02_34715 [Burkholderia pseudomallei]RFS57011.1 hypothetical protein D0U05_12460 [Burkholderia pseudomallei]RFS71285.1 hypothetical protein D0U01_03685 [Burkholderia pseudomallei]RFS74868.1 hypothetical protein D0T98_08675 [Burkholderia pseudomallei]